MPPSTMHKHAQPVAQFPGEAPAAAPPATIASTFAASNFHLQKKISSHDERNKAIEDSLTNDRHHEQRDHTDYQLEGIDHSHRPIRNGHQLAPSPAHAALPNPSANENGDYFQTNQPKAPPPLKKKARPRML